MAGEQATESGALSGIKVLELSEFVAGPYCGKLLADMGAEVIKIEKPGVGDEARKRGPFPGDIPNQEKSGLFFYLNTNKLGITLDIHCATGRELFERLVRKIDILIESNPPLVMNKLGLSYEKLKEINPLLVMTSITPFGQSGPYRDYKSYYLTTSHGGGEAYTLPGGLGWICYSDRPPIKVGGFVSEYDTGVAATIATLAAIWVREYLKSGQHIDVSQQEVLLSLMRYELTKYNEGWIESRATRSFPVAGLMQCKDGFVQLMPLEQHMWDGLMDLMGNPDWSKEERYQWSRITKGFLGAEMTQPELLEDRRQVNDYLEKWALRHTKEEIYYGAQAKGCAVGIVSNPQDLLNSEQLKVRNFFVEMEHPEIGQVRCPSTPSQFSKTPWQIRRVAPLHGEHNEEIYCTRLGYSKEQLVRFKQEGAI